MIKEDKTYRLLLEKMHEIAIVPPQTAGNFTFLYKRIVPHMKFSPWRGAFILSFAFSILLYLLLGSLLVKIVSILQFGF